MLISSMIDVAGEAEERAADHQAEAHGPHLAQGHQTQVPRQPIIAPLDRQSLRHSVSYIAAERSFETEYSHAVPLK
jgi:hypothetical protein